MADLPVFVKIPNVKFATLTDASATSVMTDDIAGVGDGPVKEIFVAGPSGSLIYSVIAQPYGDNVATVLRLAVQDIDPNATDAFATLYEQAITATTLNQATAIERYIINFNLKLQAGFKMWAWLGTAVNGGIGVSVLGGNF